MLVLVVNCWPNEFGSKCDVNIEYSLENTDMELNDVVITIPLPYVDICCVNVIATGNSYMQLVTVTLLVS